MTNSKRIRLLIAEDCKTQQHLLVEAFSKDPDIEIVGIAQNGIEAVNLTQKLKPDVITMDVRMPELDGLEATRIIMSQQPTPILIVTGNSSDDDVVNAVAALQAGALALINKPDSLCKETFSQSSKQLIRQVKAMAGMKLVTIRRKSHGSAGICAGRHCLAEERQLAGLTHIAIAASTGGPAAIGQILKDIPENFPLPILIVQHIAPGFLQGFAEWLTNQVKLKVELATAEQSVNPGVIYLAPEDKHLGVSANGRIVLSTEQKNAGFRPSADFLLQSLAESFAISTLAIVLTGMGNDGLIGAKVLHQKGGLLICQDEVSSVVYGMPKAVVDAGLADYVLPLIEIQHLLLTIHQIYSKSPR